MKLPKLSLMAATSLLTLIALCIAWELWLAPLRPGGSWLVLKAVPLLFPLLGILNQNRYTFKWSAMLILAYLAEGVVRAVTETGANYYLALSEIILSLLFFGSALAFVRSTNDYVRR